MAVDTERLLLRTKGRWPRRGRSCIALWPAAQNLNLEELRRILPFPAAPRVRAPQTPPSFRAVGLGKQHAHSQSDFAVRRTQQVLRQLLCKRIGRRPLSASAPRYRPRRIFNLGDSRSVMLATFSPLMVCKISPFFTCRAASVSSSSLRVGTTASAPHLLTRLCRTAFVERLHDLQPPHEFRSRNSA